MAKRKRSIRLVSWLSSPVGVLIIVLLTPVMLFFFWLGMRSLLDDGFFMNREEQIMLTDKSYTVNGVRFKMIYVQGGEFSMGSKKKNKGIQIDEMPAHDVVLGGYFMGETEVTQALWEAVMGRNPSSNVGPNLPVENVTYVQVLSFIDSLNALTGCVFRLPTEAEWEYAARAGSMQNFYSGGSMLEEVSWYEDNSAGHTHEVAQKMANRWGFYDMSGNVAELCGDWYGDYSNDRSGSNPEGPSEGHDKVVRGGHFGSPAANCRTRSRAIASPLVPSPDVGFRLVVLSSASTYSSVNRNSSSVNCQYGANFMVGGVEFNMVTVPAGAFMMGSTPAKGGFVYHDEQPLHLVKVSEFYLGQTEVTQKLWTVVMGKNPSRYRGESMPVNSVSYDEVMVFIDRLNKITGLQFRLPTEAEWEYAAKGTKMNNASQFSGSNKLDDVGWYNRNSSEKLHPVMSKKPNNLGLYDMSGNVWEWVSDWYELYSSLSVVDPQGPEVGTRHIVRGGGYTSMELYCRSTNRYQAPADFKEPSLGFRLALSSDMKNKKK